MEARKITIISSQTQSTKVLMSTSTTLRELKAELSAEGINYTNMDFMEGLTKTLFVNDDAILPTNVPYKGTNTNELVFVLSTTNKKITSGASLTRAQAYAEVKRLKLEDSIKQKYGKNFTQVATKELEEVISTIVSNKAETVSESKKDVSKDPDNTLLMQVVAKVNEIVDILSGDWEINPIITTNVGENSIRSPYSDKELKELITGLGK